jgi:hypothetical protein
MKTLYESILDDEEVLINNARKDTHWVKAACSLMLNKYTPEYVLEFLNSDDVTKSLSKVFGSKYKNYDWKYTESLSNSPLYFLCYKSNMKDAKVDRQEYYKNRGRVTMEILHDIHSNYVKFDIIYRGGLNNYVKNTINNIELQSFIKSIESLKPSSSWNTEILPTRDYTTFTFE